MSQNSSDALLKKNIPKPNNLGNSRIKAAFQLHTPCKFATIYKSLCPGFGQDRVNFHKEPGRDTAGRADPTWPNRAWYSIPCAILLGSGGGEMRGGKAVAGLGVHGRGGR